MLKDAAPLANGVERRLKTTAVVATFMPPASFHKASKAAPTSAGRVGHDGPWPRILAGVARLIPRVYARKPEVHTILLHEKSGDHPSPILAARAVQFLRQCEHRFSPFVFTANNSLQSKHLTDLQGMQIPRAFITRFPHPILQSS